jgi:hypothetical protein
MLFVLASDCCFMCEKIHKCSRFVTFDAERDSCLEAERLPEA